MPWGCDAFRPSYDCGVCNTARQAPVMCSGTSRRVRVRLPTSFGRRVTAYTPCA